MVPFWVRHDDRHKHFSDIRRDSGHRLLLFRVLS